MIKKLILILCVPVFFLFFSLSSLIFNEEVYAAELSSQQFLMSVPVVSFLEGSAASLPDVFNVRESGHLLDVKLLIQRIALVGWILFFVFVLLLSLEEHKLLTVFLGTLLTTAIIAALYLAPFAFSFDIFHRMFFRDGSWLFGQYDLLVNIYPVEFFYSMTIRIFTRAFVFCLASLIITTMVYLFQRVTMRSKTPRKSCFIS